MMLARAHRVASPARAHASCSDESAASGDALSFESTATAPESASRSAASSGLELTTMTGIAALPGRP
ncbi:MAG: hypothetical protein ACREJG_07105 [Candidatus Rokuibacteriota bacterium]